MRSARPDRPRGASALRGLAVVAWFAVGCRDAVAPERQDPGYPILVEVGAQSAIRGLGTLGTGAPTPGSDRQEFDFDVAADRTGRLFYRDWRFQATLTVDDDPATRITTFRDRADVCADPAHGASFDGTGRLQSGEYVGFTLVACDDGPAASGADGLGLTTVAGYSHSGRLTSGDVVKTVPEPTGTPGVERVTGLGYIGDAVALPGRRRVEFDFEATPAPGGRLVATDYRVVRADGAPGRLTVDPASDPETRITSFSSASATCVRFGGVGRLNDNNALFEFFVDACDNANPGAGADTLGITLPARPYANGGTLTGGDIAIVPTEPPTSGGNLTVNTTTTGSSVDTDGYTITVDGSSSRTIGTNASTTFAGVAAGSHTVALSGVAGNCTVSDGTSRTVTVPSGGTATVSYSVTCSTPSGTLTVSTSTSGSSLDPDGYTVRVDGVNDRSIGISGSTSYSGLTAGSHTVTLSGVASNCTVSGGTARTVTVPAGGTVTVAYSVSCVTPNRAPTVNAGSDQTVLLGLLYTLSASFSDPDNGPWSYTINWGDGSSSSGTRSSQGTISATHNYLIGRYTIRVTVTDSRGASGSDTKGLTVVAPLPGLP